MESALIFIFAGAAILVVFLWDLWGSKTIYLESGQAEWIPLTAEEFENYFPKKGDRVFTNKGNNPKLTYLCIVPGIWCKVI